VSGVADPFARWRAAQAGPAPAPRPAARAPSPPPPAEAAPPPGQVGAAPSPPPGPVGWLGSIARAIRAALADGAVRVADPAGGLCLVRLDGRHLAVAPHIVAELDAAGLLPELPAPVDAPAEDDPDAEAERIAERGAIQSEPRLPPPGTPACARQDAAQAEMVSGLLEAAMVRPSCFEGTADRPPPKGAFSTCRSRRWWYPARPSTDGTGISPDWRCTTCRPPPGLRADQIVRIET
jgi:hypothetical protein